MTIIDRGTHTTFDQPYGKHKVEISRVLEDEVPTEADASDLFLWPETFPYDMTWEDVIGRELTPNVNRVFIVHPRPAVPRGKGLLEQIEKSGAKTTYEPLTYDKLKEVIEALSIK